MPCLNWWSGFRCGSILEKKKSINWLWSFSSFLGCQLCCVPSACLQTEAVCRMGGSQKSPSSLTRFHPAKAAKMPGEFSHQLHPVSGTFSTAALLRSPRKQFARPTYAKLCSKEPVPKYEKKHTRPCSQANWGWTQLEIFSPFLFQWTCLS